MADRVVPGPVEKTDTVREAVCIDTRKIFDSCRDKDCVEDLRVYPTASSQTYIDSALSLRPRSATLLGASVNVQPISFNRGYYTVDVSYFYRITSETFPGGNIVTGLSIFDKRVILFGSEGSVRTFSSDGLTGIAGSTDVPTAVVQSVDPIALHAKLTDCACAVPGDIEDREIPAEILAAFNEPLVLADFARRWYVTIGQFSIIRLERDTQLLIPAYDYCLPDKECQGSSDEDPCALFGRINFPIEEFFPPDTLCSCEDYRNFR